MQAKFEVRLFISLEYIFKYVQDKEKPMHTDLPLGKSVGLYPFMILPIKRH